MVALRMVKSCKRKTNTMDLMNTNRAGVVAISGLVYTGSAVYIEQ
jgi:hypothetical protein